MLSLLPPRSFTDFTVPIRSDGTWLHSCQQPGDYEFYVRWLADYLFETELPLSADQQKWLQGKERDSSSVIFECSDVFGYVAGWDLDIIQDAFEAEMDWGSHKAFMHNLWLEEQEFPFEEWMCCEEADFNRLRREWEEEKAAGQEWNHADIPFRPLLSWALKQIPDRKRRIEKTNYFFVNFNENFSK